MIGIAFLFYLKVAAQTGHKVILCDTSNDILAKSLKNIDGSLSKVAKKTFKDDAQVVLFYILFVFYILILNVVCIVVLF